DFHVTGVQTCALPILRYTFLRDRDVSPYVKVGGRYPIAGGDNISSSSRPGPYGGVGVEFLRSKRISYGIEFGYDASQVRVKNARSEERRVGKERRSAR